MTFEDVLRVDQDMIFDFKLHLQPFFKKIMRIETTSFNIHRYRNMVYEEREVSVSLHTILGKERAPVPVYPPQTLHWLLWNWTLAYREEGSPSHTGRRAQHNQHLERAIAASENLHTVIYNFETQDCIVSWELLIMAWQKSTSQLFSSDSSSLGKFRAYAHHTVR